MESVWSKDARFENSARFENGIKTQVLIVGGGIAGILSGHLLSSAGIDCVIVEADGICKGVTGNTTAKITLQHGLIYDNIIRSYGVEGAKMYLKAQQTALDLYHQICSNTDCDYTVEDACVYSVSNLKNIEDEAKAYQKIGLKGEFLEDSELPIKIKGALRVKNQGRINPLKFCFSLAEKLKIYENTRVLELCKDGAVTSRGKIFADKIIVATHFPFVNKYGGYFLKMYQHRSYVLALEGVKLPKGMYVDEDVKGLSFRAQEGMLLLGGGSHRTGKKGGNWQELRDFAKEKYKGGREVAHWATQDCMTLDHIPYIGVYSPKTPHIYVATGFNKWGMTSAMAAAVILTDMIKGKENDFAKVFDPARSVFHPQLAINAAETFINMITPTVPRCPHLGCALKFNPYEHTWDCPCHGSRFTQTGKLIENPATDDKEL